MVNKRCNVKGRPYTVLRFILVCSCSTENDKDIETIKSFTKSMDLKYFYPSDASANLAWDTFAVYVCEQMYENRIRYSKKSQIHQKALNELINDYNSNVTFFQ